MADTVTTLPGASAPAAPVPTASTDARRSPLLHRAEELARAGRPGPYGVELREVPFLTQFNVRYRPGGGRSAPDGFPLTPGLPGTPNTVRRGDDRTALWLGPDEWLVVAPPDAHAATEDALRAAAEAVRTGAAEGDAGGARVAYTDVSAHSTALRLGGARARDVLRKVCAIDLHPRAFGADACAQTLLARGARVLLVADREPDGFLLFVRASFADYVTDWLLDSMAEYAVGDGQCTNDGR
ncbi:sarcosine oxidase subunit gamma [Streptomyces phytohabitans]|uniref:sarcosine oxidase subunit gamma n=1 Tax=Streptomyces phytohabitans TaxID=1150371 RepID=UPI00345B5D41